jgi:uncharacterized protein (TIGR02266 family)
MKSARESYAVARRFPPNGSIEVEVSLTSEAFVYTGLTGDIATGGVFVPTYELRPVGSEVDVRFKLPSGTLSLRARVRWVREAKEGIASGLGIGFESLEDKDRARFEEICRARPALYYDVDDR